MAVTDDEIIKSETDKSGSINSAPVLANLIESERENYKLLIKQKEEDRRGSYFGIVKTVLYALIVCFLTGFFLFIFCKNFRDGADWHFLLLLGEMLIAIVITFSIVAKALFNDPKPKDDESSSKLYENVINTVINKALDKL